MLDADDQMDDAVAAAALDDLIGCNCDDNVVGAAPAAFGQKASSDGNQALVIRVKNIGGLIAKEGGSAAAAMYQVAPQSLANMVYDRMRSEMLDKFKEKGVDADVQVTFTPPVGGKRPHDLLAGVGIGAAAVGLIWLVRGLIRRK